jgi:hypothetical protein
MSEKSLRLIFLLLTLASLQGCSGIDRKSLDETQSAEQAPVFVANPSSIAQTEAAAASAVGIENTSAVTENPLPPTETAVVVIEKAVNLSASTEPKPTPISPIVPPIVESMAKAKTSAEGEKQAVKNADYLGAARSAFSTGDLNWSSHYYRIYLKTEKRDANAWGELGNVFFSAGNLVDSAQAYFNASNILIDQGQTAQATRLIPSIRAGNPRLSKALELRLTKNKK